MTETRVARLTRAAPDDDHVRRGAHLVEDALRIATLASDADRRAYIVRHLDVGVIDPEAPSQTLALQIERRLAHVRMTAVPALSAAAATARAVWFVDDVAAIVELARRIVRGTAVEWFWRHVARGAVQRPTPSEALRACVRHLATLPEAARAIALVVGIVEAERDGAILDTITDADATALLDAMLGPVEVAGMFAHEPDVLAMLAPAWRALVIRWIRRWGADVRSLWLAVTAMIATRGSVRGASTELPLARAIVAAVLTRPNDEEPSRAALATTTLERSERDAPSRTLAIEARESIAVIERSSKPSSPKTEVSEETSVETAAAGALFLLRPLAALGMAEWLDAHAWTRAIDWPAQLLASIVADLSGPADPLVAALSEAPLADGAFVAPTAWTTFVGHRPHRVRSRGDHRVLEAFGRLPIAAWSAADPIDLAPWREHAIRRGGHAAPRAWAAHAWRRALERWLRTFTPLRLADVVVRWGTVSATPTHLDVTMPLHTVDVRVRTAGLDLDPGWVPWFGRVVRFHYAKEMR